MASKQPGPHIPSESIASQLENPKARPKVLRTEHLAAEPGPVILTEEQANKLEKPLAKETLKKKAAEMNK